MRMRGISLARRNRTALNSSGTRTTSTYDAANELLWAVTGTARTTYQYDPNGNQTQQVTPSSLNVYQWDVRNRLVVGEPIAGPVTYLYDGTGKRVEKQVGGATTKYLYDFEKVLRESDGNDVALNEYTSTNDQYGDLVSAYGNGSTNYYEFNAQFATEALLDNTGSVTDRYRYLAFGLGTHTQGSSTNEKTFVGKQGYVLDLQLELYFMGSMERPYDPNAGRFIKEDSHGYDAGWNPYQYCTNDPVNEIDPSGKAGKSTNCPTASSSLAS